MKLWAAPWKCPPPHNQTILARYGGSLCFVSYLRWRDRWVLVASGRETEIAPAPLWLCDAGYFNAHQIQNAVPPAKLEQPTRIRKSKKPAQLKLI